MSTLTRLLALTATAAKGVCRVDGPASRKGNQYWASNIRFVFDAVVLAVSSGQPHQKIERLSIMHSGE